MSFSSFTPHPHPSISPSNSLDPGVKKSPEGSSDREWWQAPCGVPSWHPPKHPRHPLSQPSLGLDSLNMPCASHQTHPEAEPSLGNSRSPQGWPSYPQGLLALRPSSCPTGCFLGLCAGSGLGAQFISCPLSRGASTLAELDGLPIPGAHPQKF